MKKQKFLSLFGISLALFTLVVPLLACANLNSTIQGVSNVITASSDAIANEAIHLEDNLFGARSNEYNLLAIPKEVAYWVGLCGINTSCWGQLFAPGSLQCVSFVTGAFAAAGDPLPAQGNAIDFWSLYKNRAGWQEITNGQGAPAPGDIVVWSGGQYGHVAIVASIKSPTSNQGGSVTVGEANGPGNTPGVSPGGKGNFYTMLWTPPTTNLPAGYVTTWPGYTVLGFIRQIRGRPAPVTPVPTSNLSALSNLPGIPPLTSAQSPYAQTALNAAVQFQLPSPARFVVQLDNESKFNPNAVSPAGAIGVAQFLPSTLAGIPCSTDPVTNPLKDCSSTGDIIPGQATPTNEIYAGAYYMKGLLTHFLTYTTNTDQAYAYAVGGYNAGQGTIDNALTNCKASQWMQCLPTQTVRYVNCIMGYDPSQCNFTW